MHSLLKKLKVGDTVYILTENRGTTSNAIISQSTIFKIGRKWITTANSYGAKFGEENCDPEQPYLREKVSFGETRLLFPSMETVNEYLEQKKLAMELSRRNMFQYSLQQLKMVKEILDGR